VQIVSVTGCDAFARSSNPTMASDFSWVQGSAKNPITKLPEPNGSSLLKYVMRTNLQSSLGAWPDDRCSVYIKATPGKTHTEELLRFM
jgi:hypothetical protein